VKHEGCDRLLSGKVAIRQISPRAPSLILGRGEERGMGKGRVGVGMGGNKSGWGGRIEGKVEGHLLTASLSVDFGSSSAVT